MKELIKFINESRVFDTPISKAQYVVVSYNPHNDEITADSYVNYNNFFEDFFSTEEGNEAVIKEIKKLKPGDVYYYEEIFDGKPFEMMVIRPLYKNVTVINSDK